MDLAGLNCRWPWRTFEPVCLDVRSWPMLSKNDFAHSGTKD